MTTDTGQDAVLEILSHAHKGESHPLKRGETSIGSGETADIRLGDAWVSREHAEIHYQQGRYWIEDIGSSNGIYVNKMRIRSRAELTDGVEIHIGQTRCRFSAKGAVKRTGSPPPLPAIGPAITGTTIFRIPDFDAEDV